MAAIANGIFREKILNKSLGEAKALPISGVILSVLIAGVIYHAVDLFVNDGFIVYLWLGISWVSLTLIVEYGFGHFVRGMKVSEINNVFNIRKGNLLVLVLLITLLTPVIFAYTKGIL
ncbi:hypothetical protein [Ferrimonas sediminum]|uniref:hypothetical protein n=1 Tax=Ferrimonas sediminum TaxID=718193 RepID=UPI001C40B06E|nr:hypothetical protein [Ferrimonas sediminum]